MGKSIKKSNLPTKICPICGLSFSWRKKWEKNWEAVRFCSDRCRQQKNKLSIPTPHGERHE
ncbi:MAG: DUF2256 domain-containing protein [Haliscomenobacter sp.]